MDGAVATSAAAVCLRCGYDLRGVSEVCPECGLGVGASVGDRERLGACPPGWVRRVAIGVGLLAASVVLMLPAGATALAMATPLSAWWFDNGFLLNLMLLRAGNWAVGSVLLLGAGPLLHLAGVWLVTGREPGREGRGARMGWPWLWRGITGVWLLAVMMGSYTPAAVGASRSAWVAILWNVVPMCAAGVALVLVPAVGLWHVRCLAVRIGRPRLAEHAGIVGMGLSTVVAVLVVGNVPETVAYTLWHLGLDATWRPVVFEYLGPATMVALPAVVLGVYGVRRALGRRPSERVLGCALGLSVLAAGWGLALEDGGYTRRAWATVAVVGVLVAAAVTFYAWVVVLLVGAARGIWGAAREAREAWRRADAVVGVREVGEAG